MERFFKDSKTLQRMHSGPLSEYIDLFAQRLCELGYTRISGRIRLRRIAQFSGWLEQRGMSLSRVTPHVVGSYLKRHGDPKSGDVATLNALLDWLRENKILKETQVLAVETPAKQFENEFALYLDQERGLAPTTVENHRLFIRRFLTLHFGDGYLDLSNLCAQDVVNFVRQQATLQPRRANLMTTALRSFLTYARYRGKTKADLAAAVPGVANWSMSSLPKALLPEQVELALAHCNRQTPMGRRDYAVLLLLARLGLRAGEVTSLTLDDIDWEAGRITVCGKDHRRSELPLLADVGKAIGDYLRRGRPPASSRLVFLRGPAPVAGFKDHRGVSLIVKHALARAGIQSPRKGAHQFRHALATQMLTRGASLSEIGDLLRHTSPRTTAIYAKVDLPALRPLALPWPGGAR
jgi:site-specific recombinase XerD